MERLLRNVEQPSLAKAQGQSKHTAGDKARIVVLATLHCALALRNWKLIW